MCASVSAACDLNAASRATSCGGPDCEGAWSANRRLNTTATAITVQNQNPTRNQRGHRRSASEFGLSWLTLSADPTCNSAPSALPLTMLVDEKGHIFRCAHPGLLPNCYPTASF